MKLINLTLGAALLLGLSGTAFAKCGGGGMGMQGDFKTVQTKMLNNLHEIESCVESAKNKQDLKTCRMKMKQKQQQMMHKKAAQCGAGKCGGNK